MKNLLLLLLLPTWFLIPSSSPAWACWTVSGTHLYTVDGDTADFRIRIWHGLEVVERVRVLEVNTPETKRATKQAGEKAKAYTEAWLARGPIKIDTCERDAFGRVLGKIYRESGENLAEDLLKSGNGVPFKRK
jgi:endonuclease YncB( thermonuclease family)